MTPVIRNAVIAMIGCLLCFWVLAALLGDVTLIIIPLFLVGLIVACTTLILREIDSLRREIRGEAPAPEEKPLSERMAEDAAPQDKTE